MIQYLKEHYAIPDRSNDSRYAAWNTAFDRYSEYVSQGIRYYNDESEDD